MKHNLLKIMTGYADSSSAFPHVSFLDAMYVPRNICEYLLCDPSMVVVSWTNSIEIELATYFQKVCPRKKIKQIWQNINSW